MNDRYPYLKSRVQRMIRDLQLVVEGCDNILARLESPLTETCRGKRNPDTNAGVQTELLRRRTKDAILHLKAGTDD